MGPPCSQHFPPPLAFQSCSTPWIPAQRLSVSLGWAIRLDSTVLLSDLSSLDSRLPLTLGSFGRFLGFVITRSFAGGTLPLPSRPPPASQWRGFLSAVLSTLALGTTGGFPWRGPLWPLDLEAAKANTGSRPPHGRRDPAWGFSHARQPSPLASPGNGGCSCLTRDIVGPGTGEQRLHLTLGVAS